MLNELNRHLLGKPSMKCDRCVVCGDKATNDHHVIQKGVGGSRKRIPTLSLCGFGNTSGCHGKAHSGRLHFDYQEGWEWCETEPCSLLEALETGTWHRCREEW